MKTLLFLLALRLSAYAAPPLLQSPRAASVPKSTPMTIPVTTPYVGTMTLALTRHMNLLFCDTNDPSCILWTMQDVQTIQRAGYELRMYFADTVDAPERALLLTSGAATFDRDTGFNWPIPDDQYPVMRLFFAIETRPPSALSFRPAAVGIVVAPEFRNMVTPRSRKRR